MRDAAQKNGIQLQYLREYNDLPKVDFMPANEKLYLQPGLKKGTGSTMKVHLVEPKEGLYSIARKYKVTVQQLKEWNKLENNDLRIGQEIIVSK